MAGQTSATGATAASRPMTGSGGTPSRASSGTATIHRAGRRERARPVQQRSFIERYRTWLIAAVVVATVAVVGVGVFAAATQPAYACSNVWEPDATAAPSEGTSPQPGYVQPDMGNTHVEQGSQVRYTYCPPASGRHYIGAEIGPIPARLFGPGDGVIPQGWVHNLEHGGLVILYRDGDADQAALRALYDAVPDSPVCGFPPGGQSPGPVIARFEQMAWPYAALVWDRVLPLESLDQAAILDFYARHGEQTNPEKLCEAPSPSGSAEPGGSPATSPSASPNASPSASPSEAPAATPSVSPS
jgi:hypothetical protein